MAYSPEKGESGRQEGAQTEREWMVEYVVEIPNRDEMRCLTILRGREMSDVQARLYDILRSDHAGETRLDVTIVRMEPVDMRTDAALFEIGGSYQP